MKQPAMKTWRKIRVVVEVPVLGDYKEKDLRYHVERLVGGSALNTRPGEDKVKFGRVRVMENAAVQRAAAREIPVPSPPVAEVRELLATGEAWVKRLRAMQRTHR